MKRQNGWIAGLMAVLVSCGAYADEGRYLALSAGYEYSSGKYGTTSTTDIVTVPLGALYKTGPWSLKLAVPYLQVTGEGDVIAGGMHRGRRAPSSTLTQTRTTQSGLGDIAVMASYNLYAADAPGSGIDLAARIKFGTASKALGTGENDYAAQLHAYRGSGDLFAGAVFGYEVLGSSAEFPLNNVYYGSVAGDYRFGEQTRVGLEYKYAQKASATGAEKRELALYANHQISVDTYLRVYLMKGYSAGSPDNGYGLSISSVY